jgi:hypothetical protein
MPSDLKGITGQVDQALGDLQKMPGDRRVGLAWNEKTLSVHPLDEKTGSGPGSSDFGYVSDLVRSLDDKEAELLRRPETTKQGRFAIHAIRTARKKIAELDEKGAGVSVDDLQKTLGSVKKTLSAPRQSEGSAAPKIAEIQLDSPETGTEFANLFGRGSIEDLKGDLQAFLPDQAELKIDQFMNDYSIVIRHPDYKDVRITVDSDDGALIFVMVYMSETAKGKGHAKELVAGFAELASHPDSAIKTFELTAADDGAWVWLKFGFQPESNDELKHTMDAICKRADKHLVNDRFEFLKGVDAAEAKEVDSLLRQKLGIWERSNMEEDLDEPVVGGGEVSGPVARNEFHQSDMQDIADLNTVINPKDLGDPHAHKKDKMTVGQFLLMKPDRGWSASMPLWQNDSSENGPSAGFGRLRSYVALPNWTEANA